MQPAKTAAAPVDVTTNVSPEKPGTWEARTSMRFTVDCVDPFKFRFRSNTRLKINRGPVKVQVNHHPRLSSWNPRIPLFHTPSGQKPHLAQTVARTRHNGHLQGCLLQGNTAVMPSHPVKQTMFGGVSFLGRTSRKRGWLQMAQK